MVYKKYLVKEEDHFEPHHFPSLAEEIDTIGIALQAVPGEPGSQSLLSFLKRKIQNCSPDTDKNVMAGLAALPLENLEAMFESCSENQVFSRQLEDYIKSRCKA